VNFKRLILGGNGLILEIILAFLTTILNSNSNIKISKGGLDQGIK
jgi:hypothetical protein